ncbi:MAG: M48 family metallopeptidase [Spirochaetaceae bacterium]|nr:MAG: M48 family metallopeptidase [Spirochaetaceae bacterium]
MKPQTILIVFLSLFFLELIWEQSLLWLNLRRAGSAKTKPSALALEIWGAQDYRRAIEYSRSKTYLAIVSSLLSSALVLVLILCGWLGALENLVSDLAVGPILRGILYVYLIALIFSLVSLPVTIYSQFVIEERYGFNRMTWKLFILDGLKGLLVSIVLVTPLLAVLFTLIRSGSLWWLWGFLLFTAFQLVMIVLYPKVIAPLFNKFTPLEEGPLKEKLLSLAKHMGFKTRGIFLMDGSKRSKHSNAYFSGLGRVKRVVLFDTLIQTLGEAEVAGVLAHEIGHQKLRHILKRLAFSILSGLLGFWILSLLLNYLPFFEAFGFSDSNPQALLVLVMFVSGPFTFYLKPFFSWWSRRHEYQADRFVKTHTEYGKAFQHALKRLGKDNLSNPSPHPLFSFYHYSHPTILERIRALDL